MAEATSPFKWDGTISLGTIIAMVGIIVSVAITGITAVNRIDSVENTMKMQGAKFDERLKAVEDGLQSLRLENAKRDGLNSQVQDHELRLRMLEGR